MSKRQASTIAAFPGMTGEGDKFWKVQMAADGRRAEIHLRGTIGLSKAYNEYGADAAGTAREFTDELDALLADGVAEITLYVASLGGYVWDALMIHDVIARQEARVTAVVDGIAASAASFVILAADEIRMPANAYLMIHNANGIAMGDHREMLDMATRLEQWTNDIAKMYARKMGDASDAAMRRIRDLMDAETWLTGEEAQAMGLVDTVTGAVELAAHAGGWRGLIPQARLEGAPEPVRAALKVDTGTVPMNEPTNEVEEAVAEESAAGAVAEESAATVDAGAEETAAAEATAAEVVADAAEGGEEAVTAPEAAATDPAPVNLAELISNAMSAAMTPLIERIEKIENRAGIQAAGVKPWGDGQPTDHVATGEAADNVIHFDGSSPLARIAYGRQQIQKGLKAGSRN